MAFRIFRLIIGVAVIALAAWLGVQGGYAIFKVIGEASQGRGAELGRQLTTPIAEVLGALLLVVLFYMTLISPSRIRKVLENIFAIPELLTKIGFTAGLLAIYRIGYYIPIPGLDQHNWMGRLGGSSGQPFGDMLETVAMLSGGNLRQSTLFGLGIMPYISASIIFQLLGTVVPSMERLQREGEAGRRKIQEYTRYATIPLCLIQAMFMMHSARTSFYGEFAGFQTMLMGVLGMTAGTVFMMWLGEQIDEYGIGNGISLLIMAGIIARLPLAVSSLLSRMTLSFGGGEAGGIGPEKILIVIAMFVFVTAGAILITQAQRRIPVQQAKQMRGRRVYLQQRSYMPLRVNHGGVMPIIFASVADDVPEPGFHGPAWALEQSGGRLPGQRVPPRRIPVPDVLHRDDLLLRVLLDDRAVSAQGNGRAAPRQRQLHSRPASRPADGGVPRARDGAHHLLRRGLPGRHRRDSHGDGQPACTLTTTSPPFWAARAC